MSPSKRLKPVQQVAASHERTAARKLGVSQRALQDAEARLCELKGYREEYRSRLAAAGRDGIGAARLREYQIFLGRLDEAIRQQEAAVGGNRRERDSRQQHWQQKYTRSQALERVVSRYQEAERRAENSREQKESDEQALRNSNRRG